MRSSCASLAHEELDMVILGQIMALSNFSEITYDKNKKSIQRQKKYTKYFHYGQQVCPVTFHFLHTIGRKRLKNLTNHFKENGLIPRVRGNTKRPPKHALSFSSIEYVVQFLVNYADQNAILLPGRVPGYRNTDLKLLPSSVYKRGIWKVYKESAESASLVHLVAYTTFCRLWRSLLPSIILIKPMSDLCWTCQKNSTAIMRAANLSDTEKSSTIKTAQDHLTLVQLERSFYKTTCDTCRQQIYDHFTINDTFEPPPINSDILPNSNDISAHYSFDYAQQVHFPSNPLQPGPIFFLTPACLASIVRQFRVKSIF